MIQTGAQQLNAQNNLPGSRDRDAHRQRIILLEPLSVTGASWGSTKKASGRVPPMGLIAIYAWLKHRGRDVEFFDTQSGGVDTSVLRQHLLAGKFDVCGIPVFSPTVDLAFETARLVKEALPQCKVVFGGIHPTTQPIQTLKQCPHCNFVIRHEGEMTFDELLAALEAGVTDFAAIKGLVFRSDSQIKINPPRPTIDNLDTLPRGSYADLDLTAYVPHSTQYIRLPNYPLMTQRGCPFTCTFCQGSTVHGSKNRRLSPERVIEELKILKFDKGARGVYFQDSTVTTNRKWTAKLMALLIRENLGLLWSCNTRADRVDPELLSMMHQAGCRRVFLGIESGNQASLDIIRKKTTVEEQTRGVEWVRQSGIVHYTDFILCLPGETEDMVRNTIRYAKTLRSPLPFWLPVPYPAPDAQDLPENRRPAS